MSIEADDSIEHKATIEDILHDILIEMRMMNIQLSVLADTEEVDWLREDENDEVDL